MLLQAQNSIEAPGEPPGQTRDRGPVVGIDGEGSREVGIVRKEPEGVGLGHPPDAAPASAQRLEHAGGAQDIAQSLEFDDEDVGR